MSKLSCRTRRPLTVVLTLLTGLGAAAVVAAAPAFAGTAVKTFTAGTTGTWTVPQGVSEVQVDMLGGTGGAGQGFTTYYGGAGDHITALLAVTAGTQYYVHVGANNGGNGAGGAAWGSGFGGGASDLRVGTDDLAGRILVAAGGGGAGFYQAGGNAGQPGIGYFDTGAQPGTSSAGGAGENSGPGYVGGDGSFGQGGGGACCGGGGGGGYYGGGGGSFGGGAGGSDYVASTVGLSNSVIAVGDRSNPYLTITYVAPPAQSAVLSSLTLPADGTSQGTLTMTVDDAYGQGDPGDTISVQASDAAVQFGPVTDHQDGTYTVPVTASSTAHDVTVTATDTSVNGVSAQNILSLTPLPQTVVFPNTLTETTAVGADYTPTLSGGPSGQPVVLSVDSATTNSSCSVTAGTVSFHHAGLCVLDADQAGNAQYAAAPTVQQTVTVDKAAQTITFDAPAGPATAGSSQTLSATSSSGAPVTFTIDNASDAGACTVAGDSLTLDQAGTCVVDADQPGTDDYTPAPTVQRSITVDRAAQTITVTSPDPGTGTVGGTYAPAATSDSGLAVAYSIDPATTNNACSFDGTTVSYDSAGTCVVDFDQAGDGRYAAADQVQLSVEVSTIATTTTATPSTRSAVYGQEITVTAAVAAGQATPAGTVQFAVDGTDASTPAPLVSGTASSGPLGELAPGVHSVTATFNPADAGRYASSISTTTLTVAQATTTTTLTVGPRTVTAMVAPVAPGAGTPTGTVRFTVDGRTVGAVDLDSSTAALQFQVPSGAIRHVAAAYSGDSDFTGSSTSTARHDPRITATITSRKPKTTSGWYRTPITVRFICTVTDAPLTRSCPAAVNLDRDGAAQSVTRTITATDGGAATVTVTGINIDQAAPRLHVAGVRAGDVYAGQAPAARCVAHDPLSGVAACHVFTSQGSNGVTRVNATATDRAGNTTHTSLTYRVLSRYLVGANYRRGAFNVRPGHAYTLVAAASTQPRYYNAAVYPQRPTGPGPTLHKAGQRRWTLGVNIDRGMRSHPLWNIAVKIGARLYVLTVRVI